MPSDEHDKVGGDEQGRGGQDLCNWPTVIRWPSILPAIAPFFRFLAKSSTNEVLVSEDIEISEKKSVPMFIERFLLPFHHPPLAKIQSVAWDDRQVRRYWSERKIHRKKRSQPLLSSRPEFLVICYSCQREPPTAKSLATFGCLCAFFTP